ncbi:TPA: hypothetical protein VDU14_006240 [Pseudomonas aeruginosa]|nr:hypothetical protein [Pseudomonas aeruginosa]
MSKKSKRNTTEQVTPEFLAAGRLYTSMCKAGLSHTPEAAAAFRHMYDAAPESFRQEMHDMAVQIGLMPGWLYRRRRARLRTGRNGQAAGH